MGEGIIKLFYDFETTGLSYKKHSVHHMAGIIEIDDVIAEKFDIYVRPHAKALIDPKALRIGGVTEEQIKAYQSIPDAVKQLRSILLKYVDPYKPKEKIYLAGYNNRKFDDFFLEMLFLLVGDEMSYLTFFWSHSIDALVLATEYLQRRRAKMPSFQLKRVAMELGIEIIEDRLHTADYDVELTREIYRIVTGRQIEI